MMAGAAMNAGFVIEGRLTAGSTLSNVYVDVDHSVYSPAFRRVT